MRALVVADIHLKHVWFDWVTTACPAYDLVVIAGDLLNIFSNNDLNDQARAVATWLVSLRVPVAVCSGNHDWWVSSPLRVADSMAEAAWLKALRGMGAGLGVDGDVVRIGGLAVLVNGWLMVPKLREPVDIVITHAPPAGCACAIGAYGTDYGDPLLWHAIEGHAPSLILAGHVHEPRRRACRWPTPDSQTVVLVPGVEEDSPVPAHWVIDTCARSAVHSNGAGFDLVVDRRL